MLKGNNRSTSNIMLFLQTEATAFAVASFIYPKFKSDNAVITKAPPP